MNTRERSVLRFACISLAAFHLAAAGGAFAQATDKPMRVVVTLQAGSAGDRLARVLVERMRTVLNQPIIVENVPAGFGRLAAEQVKAAAPDGSAVLFAALAVMVVFPLADKEPRYQPLNDFVNLGRAVNYDLAVAIGSATPARSLAEYLAIAKANPKEHATYAIPGLGGLSHFFGVMVKDSAKVDLTFVPYKGPAAAMPDLFTGRVAAIGGPLPDFTAHHRAGKLRILATSGAKRAPFLADVPTFKELGYDLEALAWYAFFAPLNTPAAAVSRVNRAIVEAVAAPGVRDQLVASGFEPAASSPEEMRTVLAADYAKWGSVIKASGFTPEK